MPCVHTQWVVVQSSWRSVYLTWTRKCCSCVCYSLLELSILTLTCTYYSRPTLYVPHDDGQFFWPCSIDTIFLKFFPSSTFDFYERRIPGSDVSGFLFAWGMDIDCVNVPLVYPVGCHVRWKNRETGSAICVCIFTRPRVCGGGGFSFFKKFWRWKNSLCISFFFFFFDWTRASFRIAVKDVRVRSVLTTCASEKQLATPSRDVLFVGFWDEIFIFQNSRSKMFSTDFNFQLFFVFVFFFLNH